MQIQVIEQSRVLRVGVLRGFERPQVVLDKRQVPVRDAIGKIISDIQCSKFSTSSRFSQKVLSRLRPSRGYAEAELRGLEWTDYTGTELRINRSHSWRSVVSLPKTRASRESVPIIPALAEILDAYRRSAGNPELGFVFRSNDGLPISLDKVVRRMIRPALDTIDLPWHGWHAFRRGLASNLYAMVRA